MQTSPLPHNRFSISLRVDGGLFQRINQHVERTRAERPGHMVSLSDVCRELLLTGLEVTPPPARSAA